MRFNTDIVFVDGSGQVRARSGDLTLRPDDTGLRDVIVGSGRSLRAETPSASLGLASLPWGHLYSLGGSFATRPTVNGSGVLLQGEINDQIASYAFLGLSSPFSAPTPLVWNQVLVQDPSYSVSGAVVTIHRDGVYEVDLVVNLVRPGAVGAGAFITIASDLLINNTAFDATKGFATMYASSMGIFEATQISKHLAFPATSGTTLAVVSYLLFGTGSILYALGSTLTVRRRGVSV